MNLHWFFRMARWARRPPSSRQVQMVFGVIAVVVAIYALEALGVWPQALTTDRMRP